MFLIIVSKIKSRGQLGNGTLNSIDQPSQIPALEGLKIINIAAGNWHSFAITDSGDLCGWGWNNYGQLATFDDDEEITLAAEPIFVEIITEEENIKVVDVSCGSRHTIAKIGEFIFSYKKKFLLTYKSLF